MCRQIGAGSAGEAGSCADVVYSEGGAAPSDKMYKKLLKGQRQMNTNSGYQHNELWLGEAAAQDLWGGQKHQGASEEMGATAGQVWP